MQYVACAAANGRFHTVRCPLGAHESEPGRIVFDDEAALPMPSGGHDVRLAVSASGRRMAVVKLWSDGRVFLINSDGESRDIGAVNGDQAIWIEAHRTEPDLFLVYAVTGGATKWSTWQATGDLRSVTLVAETDVPAQIVPTSQGVLSVLNGQPVWTDLNRMAIESGVQVSLPVRAGVWMAGQSWRADGVDAWNDATRQWWRVYDGPSPVPSVIAVLPDGQAMVAISLDEPRFIESSEFRQTWPAPSAAASPLPDRPPVVLPPTPMPAASLHVEPSMPEPDLIAFDFSRVVSTPDGGDVRRFPRTATLTDARYDHDSMVTRHTHTGKWPSLNVGPDGSAVEGNQWFLVWKHGVWMAGVNEWVRPGQDAKAMPADELYGTGDGVFYDANRFGDLFGWHPAIGEVVGVFCTTPARAGTKTDFLARTDVVFLRAQPDRTMVRAGGELTSPPAASPAVVPPPPPGPDALAQLLDNQQAILKALTSIATRLDEIKTQLSQRP